MIQLTPHPELHPIFELLAYATGFLIYKHQAGTGLSTLDNGGRWTVIAAAVVGALIGSRVLGLLEQAPLTHPAVSQLFMPGGGKTVVGGLLGGWLGVEIAKKFSGISTRTGDLFALPLCVGIAVGRIGCLFAGLADDTFGKPTSLPFGVNFGDGIARHPTQIYEIAFLALLALALLHLQTRRPLSAFTADGDLFRIFLTAYLVWRFLIDFLKPEPLLGGLNVIQWASLAGLLLLMSTWRRAPQRMSQQTARRHA